jgi:hypothetical protein
VSTSTVAVLVIIFGVLAGLINVIFGMLRRAHIWVALMRFGLALVSFGAAGGVTMAKLTGTRLLPQGWHTTEAVIYLFIGLAIFVGATLMLPSTVERNVLPAAEQPKTPTTLTGKLTGSAGVSVANNNEEWVN